MRIIYILKNKTISRWNKVLGAWEYGNNIRNPCTSNVNSTSFYSGLATACLFA
ncbi:MAG: hypothetical protein IPH20_09435 [Bacteroidales bacterium]|nr:hypothetical protein [Bacteroidales bacterium]